MFCTCDDHFILRKLVLPGCGKLIWVLYLFAFSFLFFMLFLWLHQHRLWSNANLMGLHMIIRKCRITGPTVIQNLVLLLLFRYREFLWQWLLLLKPHETDVTPTGNLRWQWFRVHQLLRAFVQDQTFPSSSSLKPFHWKDIFYTNTPHTSRKTHHT